MRNLAWGLCTGLFIIVATFLVALVSELIVDVLVSLMTGVLLGALVLVLQLAQQKPAQTEIVFWASVGAFVAFVGAQILTGLFYNLLLGGNLIGSAALYFTIAISAIGAVATLSHRQSS